MRRAAAHLLLAAAALGPAARADDVSMWVDAAGDAVIHRTDTTNSGPLNPDWTRAPRGAIHYWYGAGGYGHNAFELGGGNLLMASGSVAWMLT